jgi:hypothetical protein
MNRADTLAGVRPSITRRRILALGAAGLTGMITAPLRLLAAPLMNDPQWAATIAGMTERDTPLLIFRDYVADPDPEVEQHIRDQFHQRPDIHARIKEKFRSGGRVWLSIEDLDVRLMFVPQQQKRYAAAYQHYCKNIIDYVFQINGAENFYTAIEAPRESYPLIPETGIAAFLVHRLAKAYRGVCRITTDDGKSVKYRLSGAIFSNHLGAVDLDIEYLAPGRFALQRQPFTIWQNNSDTAYNLMAIPVEETLHYYLGAATDRQIAEALRENPSMNLDMAKALANEWMAVEESVVGGLVDQVLSRYCRTYGLPFPNGGSDTTDAPVAPLPQYRYRKNGLKLVRDLGLRQTVAMYLDHPADFKARLGMNGEA